MKPNKIVSCTNIAYIVQFVAGLSDSATHASLLQRISHVTCGDYSIRVP